MSDNAEELNVLISSPSSRPGVVFLPYIHGLLKTHCERDERIRRGVHWLKPISRLVQPKILLEEYEPDSIDVLGLSCYTWNWSAQRDLARRIKRANPECLVVAGGPHCDYDDPDFFRRNPYLDLIVEKEGEEPFRKILRQRLDGRSRWEDIPGLYLRDEQGEPALTAPPNLLEEEELLETSPYEAQEEVYAEIIREAKARDDVVAGLFETNRGCPYRCTFCDWGSLTYTAVRKLEGERVRRDIHWLARHEVTSFGIADANVGIFERDVEFIEYVAECKQRYGYPKVFGYNPTKTKADYLPRITKILHDHDLIARSIFSVQHTDPEVLDAIERTNLTREEIDELVAFNRKHGLDMLVQLILGSPGDTYPKWKRCLTDLMEWGIDGQYVVANFQVLPNAPAADPDYMDEWDIQLTTTENIAQAVVDDGTSEPSLARKNVITSTRSYDEDDWVRMWIYSHFVRAFHSMGLTHRLALYLRFAEEVPFLEFYEGLVDDFAWHQDPVLQRCVRRLAREKRDFLRETDQPLDKTELSLLSDSDYEPQYEEWLFIQVLLNRREIYDRLQDWVLDRFDSRVHPDRVRDVIRFQRSILVGPDYDPRVGKVFDGRFDWVEYFAREREDLACDPGERALRFVIDQSTLGEKQEVEIDWHRLEGPRRLQAWIDAAVKNRPYLPTLHYRNRSVTLHRVKRTRPPTTIQRLSSRLSRSVGRALSSLV